MTFLLCYVIYPVSSFVWLYSILSIYSANLPHDSLYVVANIVSASFFIGEILYVASVLIFKKKKNWVAVIYIFFLILLFFSIIPSTDTIITNERCLEAFLIGILPSTRAIMFHSD